MRKLEQVVEKMSRYNKKNKCSQKILAIIQINEYNRVYG